MMMELRMDMLEYHHQTKLQEYIVSVGNEAGYKTVTAAVTGVL